MKSYNTKYTVMGSLFDEMDMANEIYRKEYSTEDDLMDFAIKNDDVWEVEEYMKTFVLNEDYIDTAIRCCYSPDVLKQLLTAIKPSVEHIKWCIEYSRKKCKIPMLELLLQHVKPTEEDLFLSFNYDKNIGELFAKHLCLPDMIVKLLQESRKLERLLQENKSKMDELLRLI
jgi:hypothetical protein